MKISKIVFCLAMAALSMVACKKDEAKPNLSGAWQGNWGFNTDVPTFYESWSLEDGGQIRSYYTDGTLYATGTWKLNDDHFECTYKPLSETYHYTFTGPYNDDSKEINGDWRQVEDPSVGGSFTMYKQ